LFTISQQIDFFIEISNLHEQGCWQGANCKLPTIQDGHY
jgi:hypothetical protein